MSHYLPLLSINSILQKDKNLQNLSEMNKQLLIHIYNMVKERKVEN